MADLLVKQFPEDIIQCKTHYLKGLGEQREALNQLSQYAETWKSWGLQDAFIELINQMKPDAISTQFLRDLESRVKIMNESGVLLKKIKSSCEVMGFSKVYQERLLPNLVRVGEELKGKLEYLKKVLDQVDLVSTNYGPKVAERILQEVDLGKFKEEPVDILPRLDELKAEYDELPIDKQKNFKAFFEKQLDSSKSMTQALQEVQKFVNDSFLKQFPGRLQDPLERLLKDKYPEVVSGEASYLKSDLAQPKLQVRTLEKQYKRNEELFKSEIKKLSGLISQKENAINQLSQMTPSKKERKTHEEQLTKLKESLQIDLDDKKGYESTLKLWRNNLREKRQELLTGQIKQMLPYFPEKELRLLNKVGFKEASVLAFIKDENLDNIGFQLDDLMNLALWVSEQKPEDRKIYKDLLLTFPRIVKITSSPHNDSFKAAMTTLVNTAKMHDTAGIYSSSVLAKGLKQGYDEYLKESQTTEPHPVMRLNNYIESRRKGFVLADRFNDKHNEEYAKKYLKIFAEDCAKVALNVDKLSSKDQKFLEVLLRGVGDEGKMFAKEDVRDYFRDMITFAFTLSKSEKYKDSDIASKIWENTLLKIGTLNTQKEKIDFHLLEKTHDVEKSTWIASPEKNILQEQILVEDLIVQQLDEIKTTPHSVLIETLKSDPASFIQSFGSKLVSKFAEGAKSDDIKAFDKSLGSLNQEINKSSKVMDGVKTATSLIEKYAPGAFVGKEAVVDILFRRINVFFNEILKVKLDEKGVVTLETDSTGGGGVSDALKLCAEDIAKQTHLHKGEAMSDLVQSEEAGEAVKTMMETIATLAQWKGWIGPFIKEWLPSIVDKIHSWGGGWIANTTIQGVLYFYLPSTNLSEETKKLITSAPTPLITGILLALPGLLKEIQVDKYLEFLDFADQQFTKEQRGDPIEIHKKLLDIVQTLVTDVNKLMPILKDSLETTLTAGSFEASKEIISATKAKNIKSVTEDLTQDLGIMEHLSSEIFKTIPKDLKKEATEKHWKVDEINNPHALLMHMKGVKAQINHPEFLLQRLTALKLNLNAINEIENYQSKEQLKELINLVDKHLNAFGGLIQGIEVPSPTTV